MAFSFGAAPAPAFGQAPAFGGFGASTAAGGTGQAAPSLFGSPAPAFGAGPAPLFGAPASAPVFGAPASSAASSLFGVPASAPAFGAPAPAAAPLFGAPAPAAAPLFGAPAPAAAPLFGAPAPGAQQSAPSFAFGGGGGLFGGAAPGAGGFGAGFGAQGAAAPGGLGLLPGFGQAPQQAAPQYYQARPGPPSGQPGNAHAVCVQGAAEEPAQKRMREASAAGRAWPGRAGPWPPPRCAATCRTALHVSYVRVLALCLGATSCGGLSRRAAHRREGQAECGARAQALATKEGKPLAHSTKWDDMSPQAQQYLLELECAPRLARQAPGLARACMRPPSCPAGTASCAPPVFVPARVGLPASDVRCCVQPGDALAQGS
jgi:hypothetical protein